MNGCNSHFFNLNFYFNIKRKVNFKILKAKMFLIIDSYKIEIHFYT